MKYIAIDIGSSTARVMLGETTDGVNIELTELERYPLVTRYVDGGFRWDVERLFIQLQRTLDVAINHNTISGIGICSFGVDYGLISPAGDMIDMPFTYRDARTETAFDAVHSIVPQDEYYRWTGILPSRINTVYQLTVDYMTNRSELYPSVQLLLIADLFAYRLTGRIAAEITNASTTGLLSLQGDAWDVSLLHRLSIDETKLPTIITPGEVYGEYRDIPVYTVCSHDTASAIYAMGNPSGDTAFVSSGSWFIFGQCVDKPIVSEEARQKHFTNERGYGGAVTFLNNINGLFVIQRLVSELNVSYSQIDSAMESAQSLGILPLDRLLTPQDMTGQVLSALGLSEASPFDLIRTVYDSIAHSLQVAIADLARLTGNDIRRIRMTGGAVSAPYLLSRIRQDTGLEIQLCHREGAVCGSIMLQHMTATKGSLTE